MAERLTTQKWSGREVAGVKAAASRRTPKQTQAAPVAPAAGRRDDKFRVEDGVGKPNFVIQDRFVADPSAKSNS